MNDSKSDPFAEMLVCSICFHSFNETTNAPMCLPCGHTFCNDCIKQFRVSCSHSERVQCNDDCTSKTCPECSSGFMLHSVCRNYTLIRYLSNIGSASSSVSMKGTAIPSSAPEPGDCPMCQFCQDSPVSVVCLDCPAHKSLCGECNLLRHKSASTRSHRSESWLPKYATAMCLEHQQESLLFCGECTEAICTLCTYGRHKGHDTLLLSEESASCKQRIRCALAELEGVTRSVQADTAGVAQRFEEICGRSPLAVSKATATSNQSRSNLRDTHQGGTVGTTVALIHRYFDVYVESVQARRQQLIQEVQEMGDAKTAALSTQMDSHSTYVGRNYSVCFHTKQTLDHQSDVHLLKNEETLLRGLVNQIEMRRELASEPVRRSDIDFISTDIDILCATISDTGRIVTNDIDPSQCELSGDTRDVQYGVQVNKTASFTLLCRDYGGNPRRPASVGEVDCTVLRSEGEQNMHEGVVTVSDSEQSGCCTVACAIGVCGPHYLQIMVNGVEIAGSPFRISVIDKIHPQLAKRFRGGKIRYG